jgi:LuxR family maltose regulon positive regulatory protein
MNKPVRQLLVLFGHVALARVLHARGKSDQAMATLEAFAHLAETRRFVPQMRAAGAAARAQVERMQGHIDAAVCWAHASGLSATDEDLSFPWEPAYYWLSEGASNREIADRLVVSTGTIKKHVYNICSKLGVQSRTQALARARALRLL